KLRVRVSRIQQEVCTLRLPSSPSHPVQNEPPNHKDRACADPTHRRGDCGPGFRCRGPGCPLRAMARASCQSQNGMMLAYFRRCLAGRRECQLQDIRAEAPTMYHDRVPKSCRALLPAVRAIFALDGRDWDHQAQDIALEIILAETRRNRE